MTAYFVSIIEWSNKIQTCPFGISKTGLMKHRYYCNHAYDTFKNL